MSKGLTPRERQVLSRLLQGKNSAEISAELNIAVNTVNRYITTIYRFYSVSERCKLLTLKKMEDYKND